MRRRLHHRLWAGLAGFVLIACLFAGLGAIGLVGPDEPRYASIARTMAQTDDWVTPRLWGHPWFEKPILYYWAAAVAFKLFGVSDWAARLPNALAALAGALLLALAAWRFWGGRAARLALVMFPTSLGIFAFARAATMDMLLTVSVEAAMLAALFALPRKTPRAPSWGHEGKLKRRLRLALVGACIGFGTLAKGPVAIILAGGSVLLWAAVTRRWRDAVRFLRWEPVAAFAVVALPWYVACSLANPGFAYSFLWYQNVQRFLTPVFEHVQPWWFFFPILALGLVPWTPALLATARDGWRVFRSGGATESIGVFVACWAIFPLLFFSFSKSKLPGYILPAIPPLILLLARTISGIPGRRIRTAAKSDESGERAAAGRDSLGLAAIGLVGIGWIALAAGSGHWLRRLPVAWNARHQTELVLLLGTTAVAGMGIAVLAILGRPRMAVALSALWMGLLVAGVSVKLLPRLDPFLSARELAGAAAYVGPPAMPVEQFELQRDWVYGLGYYFGHELPEWSAADTRTARVYTTWKGLAEIERSSSVIDVVLPVRGQLVVARVSPARP